MKMLRFAIIFIMPFISCCKNTYDSNAYSCKNSMIFIKQNDKNMDGKLSKSEYMGQSIPEKFRDIYNTDMMKIQFVKIDVNRDDFIDYDELCEAGRAVFQENVPKVKLELR